MPTTTKETSDMNRRYLFLGAMAAMAITAYPALADNKDCNPCNFKPQPGHRTTGNEKQNLTMWVNVCHPDLHVALWWSFVRTTKNGYLPLVERVMANPSESLPDEVEVQAGVCKQAFYNPGDRILTVSDCRIQGKSVFLLSRPLMAEDSGQTLGPADWEQLPYEF